MSNIDLNDLQVMVRDKLSFTTLEDYVNLCQVFLKLVKEMQPTRIISPTNHNYIFFSMTNLLSTGSPARSIRICSLKTLPRSRLFSIDL